MHIDTPTDISAELQLQYECYLTTILYCPSTRGGQGLVKNITNKFKEEGDSKGGKKVRMKPQDNINYL